MTARGENRDRRIECTGCYFDEVFPHPPCGAEWCICPCNTRQEGPGRALGAAGAGSKAVKAARDFEAMYLRLAGPRIGSTDGAGQ